MKCSKTLSDILEAENQGSCFMASNTLSRKTLRKHLESRYLIEPYYGLYARREHWENLWHNERICHIATSLTQKIQIKEWKFTGETAAALLGLDVVKEYSNQPKKINIYVSCPYADRNAESTNQKDAIKLAKRQLKRIHLPDIIEDDNGIRLEDCNKKYNDAKLTATNQAYTASNDSIMPLKTSEFGHVKDQKENAINHVASIYNTLFVEAWTNTFKTALPTFDSAARNGMDLKKIYSTCIEFYKFARYQQSAQSFYNNEYFEKSQNPYFANIDENDIFARLRILCDFASSKSENAGESLARAAMIELGFIKPYLQYEFPNNNNPDWPIRADFAWKVNGNLIVGELDGTDKYLIACGKNSDINICNENSDTFIDGNASLNKNLIYDRDSVRRERDRERHIYDCGASNIVRFDFADVINPKILEQKLLSAGVPKVHV